jgi:hypothetical protein
MIMPVTINAGQTMVDDIVSDRFGSLWRREDEPTFELIHLSPSRLPADYGIEPDDEHQVSTLSLITSGPLTLLMRNGKPVGDELPELEPPRRVDFNWYIHDSKLWERRDSLAERLGFTPSEDLIDKMGQPFMEVTLHCTLDTETGDVTLRGATL